MSTLDILTKYRAELLVGLTVTLQLCAIVWGVGIAAGAAIGVAGARWQLLVGLPSRATSFVLGAVPVLVFLFWLHYPLQSLLE